MCIDHWEKTMDHQSCGHATMGTELYELQARLGVARHVHHQQ